MLSVPRDASCDLLIIAGEASGDEHAARLLEDLRESRPDLKVVAIGGPKLRDAGADLLFDLTRHAVVGIFEVLKNYGFFKKLMSDTLDWIGKVRPKAILFVDYPGFNLRLASSLLNQGISKKGGGEVKLLQYVSPQLWAWKPKRRFKMARTLDALGVIFPFEIETYADVDLSVRFVGHPFAREDYEPTLRYDPEAPVLLLPGSRRQPVSRILPVLLQAFVQVSRKRPTWHARIVSPVGEVGELAREILNGFSELKGKVEVFSNDKVASGSVVLTSSGTMSLACALAGIPGAIVYLAHPMTYLLGRFLVKVPHLGMANLLLPKSPPYPEFIQRAARADALAKRLETCIDDNEEAKKAMKASTSLRRLLSQPADVSAAEWLIQEGGFEEKSS